MLIFAERLIAHEAGRTKTSGAGSPTAFPVPEKLRLPLVALMGSGGYRALLSRALALAHAEIPRLRMVVIDTDGALERVEELQAKLAPSELRECRVVLLAQLLGLLIAFIGPRLTSHVIGEIWPVLHLDDLDFGRGGKNEKTA